MHSRRRLIKSGQATLIMQKWEEGNSRAGAGSESEVLYLLWKSQGNWHSQLGWILGFVWELWWDPLCNIVGCCPARGQWQRDWLKGLCESSSWRRNHEVLLIHATTVVVSDFCQFKNLSEQPQKTNLTYCIDCFGIYKTSLIFSLSSRVSPMGVMKSWY